MIYHFNPINDVLDTHYIIASSNGEAVSNATITACSPDDGWIESLNIMNLASGKEPGVTRDEYYDFDVVEKATGKVVASHKVLPEVRKAEHEKRLRGWGLLADLKGIFPEGKQE